MMRGPVFRSLRRVLYGRAARVPFDVPAGWSTDGEIGFTIFGSGRSAPPFKSLWHLYFSVAKIGEC